MTFISMTARHHMTGRVAALQINGSAVDINKSHLNSIAVDRLDVTVTPTSDIVIRVALVRSPPVDGVTNHPTGEPVADIGLDLAAVRELRDRLTEILDQYADAAIGTAKLMTDAQPEA